MAKSNFFVPKIEMLGLQADGKGVQPGNEKLRAFLEYPTPTCEKELDQFECITTYLRKFISGQADHFRIIHKAVAKVPELGQQKRGSEKRRIKVHMKESGFHWSEEADRSFRRFKGAVLENTCYRGDPARHYHLASDFSGLAYRGVLFQLTDQPVGAVMSSKLVGAMRIIQFISKKFLDTEAHYHTTEWEALVIVWCLEETR